MPEYRLNEAALEAILRLAILNHEYSLWQVQQSPLAHGTALAAVYDEIKRILEPYREAIPQVHRLMAEREQLVVA